MVEAVLLDIDGTLIDNNMLHVQAWLRAFRRVGKMIDADVILHKIGMGGDQLVPTILGQDQGEAVEQARQFHSEEYTEKGLIEHAEPFAGAVDLLRALRERGVRVALASSAKQEEVDQYLTLLGGREMVDAITMASDVSATKPAGDVFASAIEKLGHPASAVVVGDTVYDVASAGKLGLPCIGLHSGGIEKKLLFDAGAESIYEGPADLLGHLDEVLNQPHRAEVPAGAS